MTIETKHNIGDKVYGVAKDYLNAIVFCSCCNGQGGAVIPGTQIRVDCKQCEGCGNITKRMNEYRPVFYEITEIEITLNSYRKDSPRIDYKFDGKYGGPTTFLTICQTKEESISKATALANQDPLGTLHIPANFQQNKP